MPYIAAYNRQKLTEGPAVTPGELNYQFTMLISEYMLTQGLTYQSINDIVGALEGAKLEFYRRVVVPYEDAKILENGDLYNAS